MTTLIRRVRIKRYESTNVDYLHYSAYRVRIEAVDSENVDPHIFVYRQNSPNAYTGEIVDTFFSIASPVDMEEYPALGPDPTKAYPFFRLNYVELDFRSTLLAEQAWQAIVHELNHLITALNRLEELEEVEDFWVGPFPEDPFHGSESVTTEE